MPQLLFPFVFGQLRRLVMKGGTKGKTTAVYVENSLTMYNPLFSVQQIVTEKMNAIFLLVNDRNTN